MRILNLASLPVLVTTLLAGCVEPGEELVDEDDADQVVQADVSDPSSSDDAAFSRPLNARAAAAGEIESLGELAPTTPPALATWYSGTVAPGASQHWRWDNATLTKAYQVGLSPVGATTSSFCTFEVTRTWDVQNYGGEREFHFEIKNIGSISCGATILLDEMTRVNTFPTGGIAAGASKSWTWNNANPTSAAFFIGISPTGATSADPCQLEVTRTWYAQQPGGEREFKFTVKNSGAIDCQGDINIALTDVSNSSWSTGALDPGASQTWRWNNANPLDRIYVPGLSPLGASGLTPCTLEVTRSYYRQRINSDGSPEREFYFTIQNAGSLACYGTVLLNIMQ